MYKVNNDEIDEIIMGQVLTAGNGQNPARQAAINSGIPTLASPSVRRFARELGCILKNVAGSGPKYIRIWTIAIVSL